jgi:drug/metabolite transporter (DMT)-like permease
MMGLKRTKFFAVEVINKFGFAVTALLAMLILGERYTGLQVWAMILGGAGVLLFAWPKRAAGAKFVFDQGVMLTILGLLINGVSMIYYKYAANLAPSYVQFLSGRFVSDIVTWGLVWYISAVWVKRSFKKEFKTYFGDKRILLVSYGIALTNMVSSWLVYVLPASTFSMLLILSMPSAYFLGRHKYQEAMTKRMAAGSVLIALAVVGFVVYK